MSWSPQNDAAPPGGVAKRDAPSGIIFPIGTKKGTAAKLSPLYPRVTALSCCAVSPASSMIIFSE